MPAPTLLISILTGPLVGEKLMAGSDRGCVKTLAGENLAQFYAARWPLPLTPFRDPGPGEPIEQDRSTHCMAIGVFTQPGPIMDLRPPKLGFGYAPELLPAKILSAADLDADRSLLARAGSLTLLASDSPPTQIAASTNPSSGIFSLSSTGCDPGDNAPISARNTVSITC